MNTIINKISRRLHSLVSFIFRQPDFYSEKYYWNEWLKDNWAAVSTRESWVKIFPDKLKDCIDELSKSKKSNVKMLEIGSGPISFLALAAEEKMCDLVAVDPLADFYRNMLKGFGYSYPVVPINGTAERLLDLFPEESFDIVYCSNALDHTKSPKACLENIYRVVRRGGMIFLEGYSKEGTNMKWWGLHKHDIFPHGESLHCEDRSGNLTVLTDDIKVKCVYLNNQKAKERSRGTPFIRDTDDDWYTIVFRKE